MIQNIYQHRVKCGDIMDGIDDLMLQETADFIYSDPPWGQGNLKYWQTMNFKMTGAERNHIDYNNFIHVLFSILKKYSKDRVVIEYGQRWNDDIKKLANKFGFIHNGSFESLYNAGSKMLPLDIHVLSKKPIDHYLTMDFFYNACIGLKGYKLVDKIFKIYCPVDAKIILDPMCGMGYSAQATVDRGISFRGNELNKKRLDKTIKRLQK
tara:strand:+ start:824 stop:1450 length:627 start_codon:yes stop_codon:yes gene_type:complete